ncbi:hypothetical protein DFA_04122 [Cavenderia fasciculata]|uniref:Ankyrin repeat-containing protein n=1 Tax=Cavenderia fasciculata TaxID=261658 RepID=F4Q1C6_CACFS|nr:uncharacterized protein DFA_04122 [Cavenderia fasciculata]EGG18627.1 hypothetical protein DFA_04122 [Cavenderia fasciculata]|eukprot:XP_004366531.1 hypothetical protein DFA_04122 [Cavenderia fasciculata]
MDIQLYRAIFRSNLIEKACQGGNIEIIKTLVEQTEPVRLSRERCYNGAARGGHLKVFEYLFDEKNIAITSASELYSTNLVDLIHATSIHGNATYYNWIATHLPEIKDYFSHLESPDALFKIGDIGLLQHYIKTVPLNKYYYGSTNSYTYILEHPVEKHYELFKIFFGKEMCPNFRYRDTFELLESRVRKLHPTITQEQYHRVLSSRCCFLSNRHLQESLVPFELSLSTKDNRQEIIQDLYQFTRQFHHLSCSNFFKYLTKHDITLVDLTHTQLIFQEICFRNENIDEVIEIVEYILSKVPNLKLVNSQYRGPIKTSCKAMYEYMLTHFPNFVVCDLDPKFYDELTVEDVGTMNLRDSSKPFFYFITKENIPLIEAFSKKGGQVLSRFTLQSKCKVLKTLAQMQFFKLSNLIEPRFKPVPTLTFFITPETLMLFESKFQKADLQTLQSKALSKGNLSVYKFITEKQKDLRYDSELPIKHNRINILNHMQECQPKKFDFKKVLDQIISHGSVELLKYYQEKKPKETKLFLDRLDISTKIIPLLAPSSREMVLYLLDYGFDFDSKSLLQ